MGRPTAKKFAINALSVFLAFLFIFSSFPALSSDAATITISHTSATIQIGDTLQLKAYVNGSQASVDYWGSSDTTVASVSSSGLVKGKLAGSCIITAYVNGGSVECLVSVVKKSNTTTKRYNVLIMDTSGSVRGTPLAREKTAAKRFCNTILNSSGSNYIAVIKMGSSANKVCDFTSNYSTLSSKIDGCTASGETNINAAIALAGSMLDGVSASGSNVMKNIIICSDGLPTTGASSSTGRYTSANHSSSYKYANSAYKTDVTYKNKGYFVYALGFFHNSSGKDLTFGKQLMKDLASKDKYYVITDTDDLDDALDDIATTITRTTINKTSVTIKVGETVQLNTYVNGTKRSATWSSSNSTIATVSSTGLVKGKKVGTCTITAKCNGKTLKCTVTVKPAISIKLNKTSITINKKYTYQLKATVKGTSKAVTWKSSNTAIATVSNKGLVTGKAVGTCKVTASVAGKKATCKVTVVDPKKYAQTGVVKDAENGNTISGAKLYVYIGYNKTSGTAYTTAKSDSQGKYKVKLPKGKFTIVTKKDGYITSRENYEVTRADSSYTHVITLSKKMSNTKYRIVLTWGENPRDLDSHLFGPNGSNGTFHVYYAGKTAYNYSISPSKLFVNLDVDDRSSYGPETITIDMSARYVSGGTYKYYIKDYSNSGSTSSTALGYSGAKVTVYKGNAQIATYRVPKKAGTYWHVFNIVNGSVKTVNKMGYRDSNTEFNF